jgi:hypothetical protein
VTGAVLACAVRPAGRWHLQLAAVRCVPCHDRPVMLRQPDDQRGCTGSQKERGGGTCDRMRAHRPGGPHDDPPEVTKQESDRDGKQASAPCWPIDRAQREPHCRALLVRV